MAATLPAYLLSEDEWGKKREDSARHFEVHIADAATEQKYRKRFGQMNEKGLLALVKVPPELFGQKTGEIRVWFDPDLTPVFATVKRAIFFGDVSGKLQKVVASHPNVASESPAPTKTGDGAATLLAGAPSQTTSINSTSKPSKGE